MSCRRQAWQQQLIALLLVAPAALLLPPLLGEATAVAVMPLSVKISPSPPLPPTLQLIQTAPVPMVLPSERTAFEGGTLLRIGTGLHLFTTDVSRGIVNTSLVYYHAPSPGHNFTFVRQLSCCSSGAAGDPKGSLWAPMPAWDGSHKRWHLFYVQYRSYGPGHSLDPNWNGTIMHAVSSVAGSQGIGGPYRDVGVVLQPDAASQPWEGLQGTDSISPPFLLPDKKTFAAFYGSAGSLGQRNGLVTASKLGGQFTRRLPSALVDFRTAPQNHSSRHYSNVSDARSENPVVTFLDHLGLYVAVFDTLKHDPPPHARSQQFRGGYLYAPPPSLFPRAAPSPHASCGPACIMCPSNRPQWR